MWCELSLKHSVLLMPQGIVWYREHAEQEMQKTRDSMFVEFEYFAGGGCIWFCIIYRWLFEFTGRATVGESSS